MNVEQLLLQKWRSLSKDKQQEVIDCVEFLELKKTTATGQPAAPETKLPRLRSIAADSRRNYCFW